MAKALQQIGEVHCPICALKGRKSLVPLKEQGNGLAILTCGYCDTKIQTYSGAVGRGDSILRSVNLEQPPEAPPAPVEQPQKPQRGNATFF
jgi:hypothetical protein